MSSHVSKGLPEDVLRTLVAARRARHWSQRDLAAKVGLPQVHISAIETGKVTPRYDTLLELVRVLGHDLLLVPRALVPVGQALVRDFQAADREGPPPEDLPLYADETEETA